VQHKAQQSEAARFAMPHKVFSPLYSVRFASGASLTASRMGFCIASLSARHCCRCSSGVQFSRSRCASCDSLEVRQPLWKSSRKRRQSWPRIVGEAAAVRGLNSHTAASARPKREGTNVCIDKKFDKRGQLQCCLACFPQRGEMTYRPVEFKSERSLLCRLRPPDGGSS